MGACKRLDFIQRVKGWEDNGKTKHAKTLDTSPRLQLQKTSCRVHHETEKGQKVAHKRGRSAPGNSSERTKLDEDKALQAVL